MRRSRRAGGSPQLGVLILSAYVEPVYTSELLASSGEGGIGYLLKERVGDVRGFLDALERVAEGGTALDREVVSELMHARDGGGALAELTPREREVLELVAEGRTNAAIARAMVVRPAPWKNTSRASSPSSTCRRGTTTTAACWPC